MRAIGQNAEFGQRDFALANPSAPVAEGQGNRDIPGAS